MGKTGEVPKRTLMKEVQPQHFVGVFTELLPDGMDDFSNRNINRGYKNYQGELQKKATVLILKLITM